MLRHAGDEHAGLAVEFFDDVEVDHHVVDALAVDLAFGLELDDLADPILAGERHRDLAEQRFAAREAEADVLLAGVYVLDGVLQRRCFDGRVIRIGGGGRQLGDPIDARLGQAGLAIGAVQLDDLDFVFTGV